MRGREREAPSLTHPSFRLKSSLSLCHSPSWSSISPNHTHCMSHILLVVFFLHKYFSLLTILKLSFSPIPSLPFPPPSLPLLFPSPPPPPPLLHFPSPSPPPLLLLSSSASTSPSSPPSLLFHYSSSLPPLLPSSTPSRLQ